MESAQPDASSQEEIDAVKNLAGTDAAPDVLDLGPTIALANTDLYAPYMVAEWADIPDNLKDPDGLWVSDYTGFMSIGSRCRAAALPATVADLLKPEYAGMIALNGNPTQSGAGFNGVVMAALANGGSADDIAPGVDFFKQLNEAGNLLPVDPDPRDDRVRTAGLRHRLGVPNAAQTSAVETSSTGRSPSPATPDRWRPTTSRRSTRKCHTRPQRVSGGVRLLAGGSETPGSRASRAPFCRTSSSPTGRSTRRPSPTWPRSPARPSS